jgi:polyferredoxin
MKPSTPFRLTIKSLVLFTFIFLLFSTTYPIRPGIPYDLFLRLDPLAALGTILGSGKVSGRFLISLLLVAFTLLAGRLFCGYLCPLGITLDLTDGLALRRKTVTREENQRYRGLRNLKYYLLLLLIVSGLLGFSLFYAFDPISLITRSFTSLLYPLAIFLVNLFLDLVRPLAEGLGFIRLAHAHYTQPVYGSNFVTFLILVGILGLVYFSRRFWCRYCCPLGALLGIFSRLAPIRRRVTESCTECGRCQESCPMDAIKDDPHETVQAECIGCQTCARICPEGAVDFTWVRGAKSRYRSEVALSRRGFVYSIGAALALAFLARTSPARALTGKRPLLRPPGALPEGFFNNTCIRCGQCIKSCITNTLQPCFLEAGLEGLWTPRPLMRLAGCEQSCNACGQVCPTQAIRALPLEEKRYARIGTAVLRTDKCIAWEQDRICLVCDEACPYNAIVFKMVEGQRRPFVDELKCNGCGICEQVCPIEGESAIKVEPMGQIRLREGSYLAAAKIMNLELKLKAEKDMLDEK